MKDASHPFFRPLWRRIAVVGVCFAWALFELVIVGDQTWAIMTAALGAYGAWTFLITYKPTPGTAEAEADPAPPTGS